MVESLTEGHTEIQLLEYSMRLEYLLAVGSETAQEFRDSQAAEIEQLEDLGHLLREKASYVSGEHPELAVNSLVESLSVLTTAYGQRLAEA